MSSASSAVTYISVYTDSEPGRVFWGADEEMSDRVPQDEGEHEPMFIQPHDPDYMPEPMYPEYIPLEDEHVLSAEEQPLPLIDSPTTEWPRYVAESDPEEDPEEYEDDETKDSPVDYPMDGGDDGDDDDGNSSRDYVDNKDEDEEDEEEEHLAPADSAIVIPTVDLVAISLPPEAEVERLLAMPTLPPSPLTSLSPPYVGERLARCMAPSACPSPPPIPSPLLSSSGWPTQIQTLRMASTQALIDQLLPYYHHHHYHYLYTYHHLLTVGMIFLRYHLARGEVNTMVTELAELHEHDTQDLYALLEDAQDSVYIRVLAPGIPDTTTIVGRQAQMAETLRVMRDMRREMGDMQAELLALREQPRRARQPGEDARVPDCQDAPRDADNHI
nr:hypothetical protein [Tanacetum cinerariifolium]